MRGYGLFCMVIVMALSGIERTYRDIKVIFQEDCMTVFCILDYQSPSRSSKVAGRK